MDLLRLAEALLSKGIENGDKEKVKTEVETGHAKDVIWPEEEPVLVAEEETKTEVQAEVQAEETVSEAEPEVPVSDVEPEVEDLPARPVEEEEDLLLETEPPFEGEPVKDSTGWVSIEPEEDYYSGWSEAEDEQGWDVEWLPEDLEEEGERPGERPRAGTKKRGRRRPRRTPEYNDDFEAGSGRGRRPARSRQ